MCGQKKLRNENMQRKNTPINSTTINRIISGLVEKKKRMLIEHHHLYLSLICGTWSNHGSIMKFCIVRLESIAAVPRALCRRRCFSFRKYTRESKKWPRNFWKIVRSLQTVQLKKKHSHHKVSTSDGRKLINSDLSRNFIPTPWLLSFLPFQNSIIFIPQIFLGASLKSADLGTDATHV